MLALTGLWISFILIGKIGFEAVELLPPHNNNKSIKIIWLNMIRL